MPAGCAGWQMIISIARKLQAVQDMLFPGLRWEIVQVGLTPEQVRKFNLPEEPIKKGDKRAKAWEDAFGVKQTEIDALTTREMAARGILRQLLDDAIEPYFDSNLTDEVERAAEEWQQEANAAVEEQLDDREMARLRREVARLQDEIEGIEAELHETVEGLSWPRWRCRSRRPTSTLSTMDGKPSSSSIPTGSRRRRS